MSQAITVAADVVWLDEQQAFSLTEFVAMTGLSAAEVVSLMDCEALVPVTVAEPATADEKAERHFSAKYVILARAASRLRRDFELDTNALSLTLRLLDRIHALETELLELRAQRRRPAR